METLIVMLKNVLIFLLLALPGYLLVKGKILRIRETEILSKLLTNLGMPFLVLSSTLKLQLNGEFTKSIIVMAVLGALFLLLMFFTSAWLVRGVQDKKKSGAIRFCMMFVNNGFIGIPLVSAVFGEGSPLIAYLIVLNIVMNMFIFTVGIYLISGDRSAVNLKKAFLTPVFVAFLAGITLNLLGVGKTIPEIQTYATHLSGIVTPLAMLVLGMKMTQVPMKRLFTSGWMYYTSAVRLLIYPAVGVAAMLLLRNVPFLALGGNEIIAFFIGYALPTATMGTVLCDQYEGDTETAVTLTLGMTILSVITIPVLYWLLCMIV